MTERKKALLFNRDGTTIETYVSCRPRKRSGVPDMVLKDGKAYELSSAEGDTIKYIEDVTATPEFVRKLRSGFD